MVEVSYHKHVSFHFLTQLLFQLNRQKLYICRWQLPWSKYSCNSNCSFLDRSDIIRFLQFQLGLPSTSCVSEHQVYSFVNRRFCWTLLVVLLSFAIFHLRRLESFDLNPVFLCRVPRSWPVLSISSRQFL